MIDILKTRMNHKKEEKNLDRLYEACMQIPVQIESVRKILDAENYSPEALSSFMIKFIDDNCFLETRNYIEDNGKMPEQHELHCGYLCDLIRLFLEYGLNPNSIHNNQTVLSVAAYVDCGYVAANAVRFLLEHGANPNMIIDGESTFDELDFDIVFGSFEQEDRRMYDNWIHTWCVMIGYGGKPSNGTPPLKMKEGYTFDLLRNHEEYDFFIEKNKDAPEGWILHIFERESKIEIATL